MSFLNDGSRYGWITQILHWVFAIAVIILFVAHYLPGSVLGQHHLIVGGATLALLLLRWVWQFISKTPENVADPSPILLISFIVRWVLYGFIIINVIFDIAAAQIKGASVKIADYTFPSMLGEEGIFEPLVGGILNSSNLAVYHDSAFHIAAALVGWIILATCIHHFLLRDDTLKRLWFTYKPPYFEANQSSFHK